MCQEQEVQSDEIMTLKHAFQLNAYPIRFITRVLKLSSRSIRLKNEVQGLGLMPVPCIRGFSEKFKRISNRCNIKTVFKTGHSLRNSLMRTRQKKCCPGDCELYLRYSLRMWQELHWGDRQTEGRETPGTQQKKLEVGHLERSK
jgi:hypothetical protein